MKMDNKYFQYALLGILVLVILGGHTYHMFFHKNMKSPTNVNSDEASINQVTANTVNIEIKDYEYTPSYIKIKKGTTVVWTNIDVDRHNAMRDHGEEHPHNPEDVHNQATHGFNSPLLAQGESWSYTFNEEKGMINYHCGPHPHMKGVIEIIE
jgi:plastocyanin